MTNDITIGRFAPTPSGYMHAGNITCALLAYLSAKSKGGKFIVRIEDLDKLRCPFSAARDILDLLSALGLKSDEPPIYQSERTDAYIAAEKKLARVAELYPCFCSRAELHAATAPRGEDGEVVYSGTCKRLSQAEIDKLSAEKKPCTRIAVPDETISFTDGVRGEYSQNLAEKCGDFILRRGDGVYAYQLAVVVDDGESGVNEIVRGGDLLSSTPRQIFLQRLLGLPQPQYYHVPLVRDGNGKKLSKSEGDSARTLLVRHTVPEALGLLAFGAGILPELRPTTLAELVKLFDWKKVNKSEMLLPQYD